MVILAQFCPKHACDRGRNPAMAKTSYAIFMISWHNFIRGTYSFLLKLYLRGFGKTPSY